MKQKDFTEIVPSQYTGKEIEADASIVFKNDNEAKVFYQIAKQRLLKIDDWHQLAGMISATFQLVDNNGAEADRNVKKGDYIKIDIPGPGSKEGDGYDWVRVEEIREMDDANIQSIGFRVRPSENPLGHKEETAHFYSDEATSNFIVTRERNKVSAMIIDRNIKPNDDTESLIDKVRHTAIAISAIGRFSKIQWQNLAEGFLKTHH